VKKSRGTGMFRPHWYDLDGKVLAPLRGRDIAVAHRLWREHADIRCGRVEPVDEVVELAGLFGLNGFSRSA